VTHFAVKLAAPTVYDSVAVDGGLILYCVGDRLWHEYRFIEDPNRAWSFIVQDARRHESVPAGIPIVDSLAPKNLWIGDTYRVRRFSKIGVSAGQFIERSAAWDLPQPMTEYAGGLAVRAGVYLPQDDGLYHLVVPVLQNGPVVDPGDWTWVTDDTDSDLIEAGSVQSKRMLPVSSPGNSGTFNFNVSANSTVIAYFFSGPGSPGSDLWSSLATVVQNAFVTTANSRIELAVQLARVSANGMFRQSYASFQGTLNLGGTGSKVFAMTPVQQIGVEETDRLRVGLVFTRGLSLGTGAVSISFGDVSHDTLVTPISYPTTAIVALEDIGAKNYVPFSGAA
jgi:hypothetical protein